VATQTFTFLFTDIEGSTAMAERLGNAWTGVLADHHRLIRGALAAHGGEEVVSQGDGVFAVFASPRACVDAAIEAQRALLSHAWPAGEMVRVRMGIHYGEAAQTTAGRHAPRTGGSSDFVPWAPALAERGPQDVLGGVGGGARGDRVDVGAVQLTEVDAVEGNRGVVARELQLPGRLADVHLAGAWLGDAHDSRHPYLVH